MPVSALISVIYRPWLNLARLHPYTLQCFKPSGAQKFILLTSYFLRFALSLGAFPNQRNGDEVGHESENEHDDSAFVSSVLITDNH